MKEKRSKNSSLLYQGTEWVFDFILLSTFTLIGIALCYILLDINIYYKLSGTVLIFISLMVIGSRLMYNVKVYNKYIEIMFYLRVNNKKQRILKDEVCKIRYNSYALNQPSGLEFYFFDKKSKVKKFRLNIEESKAIKIIELYKSENVELIAFPENALEKFNNWS